MDRDIDDALVDRKLDEAKAEWHHQDNLLQQYRTISMTAQSFLLTVGTIVASAGTPQPIDRYAFLVLLAIGITHIAWLWVPVVTARGHIVNFYKFQAEGGRPAVERLIRRSQTIFAERWAEGEPVTIEYSHFAGNKRLRAKIYSEDLRRSQQVTPSSTRFKLDVLTPLCYGIVWFALAVIVFDGWLNAG